MKEIYLITKDQFRHTWLDRYTAKSVLTVASTSTGTGRSLDGFKIIDCLTDETVVIINCLPDNSTNYDILNELTCREYLIQISSKILRNFNEDYDLYNQLIEEYINGK